MELNGSKNNSDDLDRTDKNSLRKSIHEFINVSLQKDEILDSEWETFLVFIEHAMKICPEFLVYSSRSSTSALVPNQSHAFLMWVLQNLLRVVTQATSVQLTTCINSCIQNIFNLTKSRDHPVFCFMLRETVQLVADLSDMYRLSTTPNVVNYPVFISHFQYSPTKSEEKEPSFDTFDISPILIEIESVNHLGSLLEHILLTVNSFSSEVCMFCQGVNNQMYGAVCYSLKYGDLNIKLAAMTLLETLIKGKEFSSLAIMDNVLWSLIALINLCTKLLLDGKSVPIEFQQKMCSCLRVFFCPSDDSNHAVLRFWDHLLSALLCVLAYKSYSLCCVDLQVCIGELLHKCSLMTTLLPSFRAETIVDCIGQVNNMQPLVPTLCQLVWLDLNNRNVGDDSSRKEDSEKTDVSLPKSASLSSHLCQRAVYLAQEIARTSLDECHHNDLLCVLEGIRSILDTYSRLHSAESSLWWSNEDINLLCKCWRNTLSYALTRRDTFCQPAVNFLDKVLSVILDNVGALLYVQDQLKLSANVINQCLQMVLLTWPPIASSSGEVIVSDTIGSPVECQLIRETLQQSPCDGILSKQSSLWAVVNLTTGSFDKYKFHCFKSAMSEDSSHLSYIVKVLPLLFESLKLEDAVDVLQMIRDVDFQQPDFLSRYIHEIPVLLLAMSGGQLKRLSNANSYSVPAHYSYELEITAHKDCRVTKQLLELVIQPVLDVSEPKLLTALLKCFTKVKTAFVLDDPQIIDQKCLQVFTHCDSSVQTAVSAHIRHLFTDEENTWTTARIEQHPVIVRLKDSYQSGAKGNNIRLQEFTVLAFGQICRFSEGNLFTTCLVALLKFNIEPSLAIKAVAYVQLQRLAKSLKLQTTAKLLSRYKEPICQLVVNLLHEKKHRVSSSLSKKDNLFHQMATAFDVDLNKYFEITKEILVPLLVCRASPESSSALDLLAKQLNTSTRNVVVNSFKYIFLHVIQRGGQKVLQVVSTFLKSEFEFEMTDLLRSASKNILNQLLLHLSTHRDRMLSGVQMLAELEPHWKDPSNRLSSVDYLQPHLLGVIAFFNFTLVRSDFFENNSYSKGVLALESLMQLMELMGAQHITDVKMKIITMLRHCLTFKDSKLIKVALMAWNTFIHCVELDSLGPLLGQIVVALSPFVSCHPEAVSSIFKFLIVENRVVMSSFFNEIYLMPETAELAEVNKVLREYSETPRSLHEQLRHVLKGVAHERSDVTRDALKSLYALLKSNKMELQKYMVGSDTVDPIITEIVTTILQSLRGADAELREQYGKCLGELGAIDPGKLDIPIARTTRVVKFYEIDDDFVVDLLSELARAYLASSNTRSQDCCAFAIQEILKLFDCKNTDPESKGAQIWAELSEECQEVLRPHLNSNYSATISDPGKITHPIFKLSKKIDYHQWLQKWSSYLIHKLEDGTPKQVFVPCSLIFQHDKSTAQYLLPFVLTSLLSTTSDDITKQVLREVMAVLKSCANNRDTLTDHADFTNMCAQTIFTALDHLSAWANGKNKASAVRKAKGLPMKGNPDEVLRVTAFLEKIPKEVLAHAAFRCQAYTRSLMYFESHVKGDMSCLRENLGFLQKVYVALGDSDSVAGAATLRTSDPDLGELTLQYESTGNYRDAGACYEKVIQKDPDNVSSHEGLLRCMLRQGEFTSALMHVDGLQTSKPTWLQRLNTYRVEAAWNLGQWDVLQTHLNTETPGSKNWNVNLGRLLLTAKQKDFKSFSSRLSKVRMEQMGPLCTATLEQGSYKRAYEYIVRLHMLQELEEGVVFSKNKSNPSEEITFMKNWEARFQVVQESFRTQEPILSLRRVMLGIESKNDKRIGKSWLRSAKIARRDGHLQTALSFLLNARDYSLPGHCMEWAEYKKTQLSSYEALQSLQKAVNEQWPEVSTQTENESSQTHAEALLLIGKWMEDTAHCDTQTVLRQYKNVIAVQPESEDGHFYLGKYYDRLMTLLASDRPSKSGEFLQFIVRHYSNTLQYGSRYIYQCMPRMLTLWLDFGSNVPDSGKKSQERSVLKTTLSQLNELMKTTLEVLPPYQFLIAFSQVISRICHPNSDVFSHLEAIVLKLLRHYPQQALWMMIAVRNSTHSDRKSRCERILNRAKKEIPDIGKLIDDVVKLSDKLLDVCNKHVDAGKSYSMDKFCRSLPRLISSSGFSSVMVPLQSSMTVTLPGSYCEAYEHDPFPGEQPSIVKFDDKVEVLASLQRPKKITVIGSDGNAYILLCKPKDDLRKDARLMEFNTVVNKCLRKDQNSRQRRLHIRTYAVVPLNEECGLLEWVPNTLGLRHILSKLYQEKGKYVSGRDLKDIYKNAGKDPKNLKDLFLTKLLPRQPAVFGEWFLRTFPDPTAWYSSRQAYSHTAAVMSIVGYILGLGDRHGENILFDSTCGDCVHVDFNCLFNRGETFDVPEVVPFRLTHNMVHGMGVTGYEGMFRKSCEATMKVLRQECDALMCVLKTFIHDPLVEWEKVKGRSSSETANDKPLKIIHDIEDRLNGKYPQKTKGLPLSVEGQVDALIKEATDVNNLCKMYVGWAPFM